MPRLLAPLFLLPSALACAASHYQLTLSPDHPGQAQGQLRLSADQAGAGWLTARGQSWGLASQIRAPHCGRQALARQGDRWFKPAGCRLVSWQVVFAAARTGQVDPSRQQSLYFAGETRWLLSESVSLLRPERDTGASLSIRGLPGDQVHGGGRPQGGRWPLPDTGQAPAFFALGRWPVLPAAGAAPLTSVADQPAALAALGLQPLQQQALAWQRALLQLDSTEPLLLIWLRMDPAKGRVAGAAGRASLLAGYLSEEGAERSRRQVQSLMTVAHEQFHLLAAQKGQASHPGWFDESLAQYYALQTLQHSGLPAELVSAVRARFIDPERKVERGLLAWQQRHQDGDPAAYAQFYLQGATFWSELDRLLLQASAGQRGLDADLPVLLMSKTDATTPLPTELVQQWRALLGPRLDVLLARYLGPPDQSAG